MAKKKDLTKTEVKYVSALIELTKRNKKSPLWNMLNNFNETFFKKIGITEDQIENETNLDKIRDMLENVGDPKTKKSPKQETIEDINVFLFKNKKIPPITRLETGLLLLISYYKKEMGEKEFENFLQRNQKTRIIIKR
jgi:hypothetical protein